MCSSLAPAHGQGGGIPRGPPGWAQPAQRPEAGPAHLQPASKQGSYYFTGKHTSQGGAQRGCDQHPRSHSSRQDVTWERPCSSSSGLTASSRASRHVLGEGGGRRSQGHCQTPLHSCSRCPCPQGHCPTLKMLTTKAATREPHSKVHVPNVNGHSFQTPLCPPTARQTLTLRAPLPKPELASTKARGHHGGSPAPSTQQLQETRGRSPGQQGTGVYKEPESQAWGEQASAKRNRDRQEPCSAQSGGAERSPRPAPGSLEPWSASGEDVTFQAQPRRPGHTGLAHRSRGGAHTPLN